MKTKKIKLKFKGKEIELEAREMKGINKALGLIVYRNKNLLFEFKKGRRAIHSLFCPHFLALWLDKENKIVEIKLINKWKLSIKPEKDYTRLIEIPVNSNSEIKKTLLDFVSFLDAEETFGFRAQKIAQN